MGEDAGYGVGRCEGDLLVFVDDDALEECAVEDPAFGRFAFAVEVSEVGEDVGDLVESFARASERAGEPVEPLGDCIVTGAYPALLALEQVERDRVSVVSLDQLEAFGFELVALGFQQGAFVVAGGFELVEHLPQYRADAVERFAAAFDAWMETQVESDHLSSRGLFPTVWDKEGQDATTVRRLELDVAEAAGLATRAVAVTGAYIAVAGLGMIDPISNWSFVSAPKAPLAPRDIRMTTANVKGRLDAMIVDAHAGADSDLPSFAPAQFHPVIWAGAAAHWTTHQYRVAVREAAEGLTVHWKQQLRRHNVDDTVFWQQTLSPGAAEVGKPKLAWPGDPEDKTTKSMRGGLEPLAKSLNALATGLNLTVRNVTTHTRDELSEQEAMERLAAYSYLARLLDQCTIDRVDDDPRPDADHATVDG